MSTLKLFAIHDQKAAAFLQPFFSRTISTAVREVTEVVNDPQHAFSKYSADYTLYAVGEFEEFTGVLTSYSESRLVGNLVEFKTQSGDPLPIPAFLKRQAD